MTVLVRTFFGVAFLGMLAVGITVLGVGAMLLMQHLRFLPTVAFARNGGEGGNSGKQAERFHRRPL